MDLKILYTHFPSIPKCVHNCFKSSIFLFIQFHFHNIFLGNFHISFGFTVYDFSIWIHLIEISRRRCGDTLMSMVLVRYHDHLEHFFFSWINFEKFEKKTERNAIFLTVSLGWSTIFLFPIESWENIGPICKCSELIVVLLARFCNTFKRSCQIFQHYSINSPPLERFWGSVKNYVKKLKEVSWTRLNFQIIITY